MARKKRVDARNIFDKYLKEFLSFLLSLLEEGTGDLIKKFSEFINFKKRLQRYVISIAIVIASLTLVFYGLGSFIGSLFPNWKPGVAHMLVGVIFILIGWIYRKYG